MRYVQCCTVYTVTLYKHRVRGSATYIRYCGQRTLLAYMNVHRTSHVNIILIFRIILKQNAAVCLALIIVTYPPPYRPLVNIYA